MNTATDHLSAQHEGDLVPRPANNEGGYALDRLMTRVILYLSRTVH